MVISVIVTFLAPLNVLLAFADLYFLCRLSYKIAVGPLPDVNIWPFDRIYGSE